MRRVLIIVSAVVVLACVLIAARREEGVLAPAYSPDGGHIYFVRRSTTGLVLGLGYEIFTPPATVIVTSDRFELCRIQSDGKQLETLLSLPRSPLEGQRFQTYHGGIFIYPQAALRFHESLLEYEIGLSIPRQPTSETHSLRGEWNVATNSAHVAGVWDRRSSSAAPGEDVLHEPWEVLAVPGREGFPCAIAAHNDQTSELRIVWKTNVCDSRYPAGIRWGDIAEMSRSKDIRRLRHIRSLHEQYLVEARSAGLGEGEALLRAARQLQELGYSPRPAQLVAREIGASERPTAQPLIHISDMEFKVGLFPDIEKAMSNPGKAVEKGMGNYLTHRDYTTSRTLNDLLATGTSRFYIERGRTAYEITVIPARPATR